MVIMLENARARTKGIKCLERKEGRDSKRGINLAKKEREVRQEVLEPSKGRRVEERGRGITNRVAKDIREFVGSATKLGIKPVSLQ